MYEEDSKPPEDSQEWSVYVFTNVYKDLFLLHDQEEERCKPDYVKIIDCSKKKTQHRCIFLLRQKSPFFFCSALCFVRSIPQQHLILTFQLKYSCMFSSPLKRATMNTNVVLSKLLNPMQTMQNIIWLEQNSNYMRLYIWI